ncbi:hypothetical protein NY605_18860, partial [Enterobacter hormaechei]|uniref:hypothetical protein n=1 Tax=Enterobacter hormaechei TaxID=158836 RepID=UPI0022F10905
MISVGYAKVIDPTLHILPQFKQLIAHADSPIAVRQSSYLLFENVQRVGMPLDLSSVKGEAKELALTGTVANSR